MKWFRMWMWIAGPFQGLVPSNFWSHAPWPVRLLYPSHQLNADNPEGIILDISEMPVSPLPMSRILHVLFKGSGSETSC